MRNISDTVKHIIIINVIFWVATLLIGKNGDFMNDLFDWVILEKNLGKS